MDFQLRFEGKGKGGHAGGLREGSRPKGQQGEMLDSLKRARNFWAPDGSRAGILLLIYFKYSTVL